MTAYCIDYINTTAPTVEYAEDSQALFESAYGLAEGRDIGGLVVYNDGNAVYDYENYVGWVRS